MDLNRFPPPPLDFFKTLMPLGQAEPLVVDIGGLAFRLEGADKERAAILKERYAGFLTTRQEETFEVVLLDAEKEHFVRPDEAPVGTGHPLSLAWDGPCLLVQSFGFAGWAAFEERRGAVALARAEYERSAWCVENYLRVVTAWRALREGGALLHAASLVLEGKGYLFMGASGSGKSTLAATSRQGEVLSDDLSLVRFHDDRFMIAGTPFRGTYTGGRKIQGEFPIAGMFRILKSADNRREPVPPGSAVTILLASAPFVVDQIERDGRILENLRRLDAAHPLAYLHFDRSGSFWSAILGR
ncbi:MAG TPA: hypothetical protein VFW45_17460 [Candidatus Polarisedimenticolia bacterium]|nr:hypothetical protein [Candidatus Polarisedimenticolia bacterium]